MTVFEDTKVVIGGENSTVKDKENSVELVTVVEIVMKNQRGVTLVELLVTHCYNGGNIYTHFYDCLFEQKI